MANQVVRTLPVEIGCIFTVSAAGRTACSRSLVLFDTSAVAGRTIRNATLRLQTTVAGSQLWWMALMRKSRAGAKSTPRAIAMATPRCRLA